MESRHAVRPCFLNRPSAAEVLGRLPSPASVSTPEDTACGGMRTVSSANRIASVSRSMSGFAFSYATGGPHSEVECLNRY